MDPDDPPHPKAVAAVIDVWSYYCAGCGTFNRIGWYPYTDEQGSALYCSACAPRIEGDHWGSWKWCRRGRHVIPREDWRHSHAKQKPERPSMSCARCGAVFTPLRSDARFCSGACRVAAHRARSSSS